MKKVGVILYHDKIDPVSNSGGAPFSGCWPVLAIATIPFMIINLYRRYDLQRILNMAWIVWVWGICSTRTIRLDARKSNPGSLQQRLLFVTIIFL